MTDMAVRLSSAGWLLTSSPCTFPHSHTTCNLARTLQPTHTSDSSDVSSRAPEHSGLSIISAFYNESALAGRYRRSSLVQEDILKFLSFDNINRRVSQYAIPPTMSITDAQLDAADDENQITRSSLFTNVKNYLISLGLPSGNLLTQHATDHHHEDVPAHLETDTGL